MSFRQLIRPASTFRARAAAPAVRAFSVSAYQQKTIVDSVKETVKDIDRKAGKAAVTGIEAGEQAVEKTKEAVGIHSTEELKGKASGKVEELKGQASGKSAELQGKAKGAAEEAKSKM